MIRTASSPAVFCLFAAGVALAGCASSDKVATPLDPGPSQPRTATYSCADGGNITIENLGGSIRLLEADGSTIVYPANPAGQQNRFGDGPNAVVIEGSDALVMHGNMSPLVCTR